MRAVSKTPEAGELIAGKYYLQHELGRGGMGAVYAVVHHATGRKFALKLLNPRLAGNRDAEARFLREAMLASAINHPAIVDVYDVGRHGDAPYMVMKLLEGESLAARIARGPLAPDEAIGLLLPVLDGVSAAHARGILHRDLKPDNILLARDGDGVRPQILDFGVCKLLGPQAEPRLTHTGISIGTPLYMSPEQLRGESSIDARADVYALGVILYQMLTGRVPYEADNFADLVVMAVAGKTPSARLFNPAVSVTLDRLIARAMASDAAQRYPSADALAADLRRQRSLDPQALDAQVARAPALQPGPVASALADARRAAATPDPRDARARASTPTPAPSVHGWVPAQRGGMRWALVLAVAVLALVGASLWSRRAATPHAPARPVAAAAPRAPAAVVTPAHEVVVISGPANATPPIEVAPPPPVEVAPRDAPTTAPSPPRRRMPPARPAAPPARPDVVRPDAPDAPRRWRVPNEIIDPFDDPG